MVRTLSNLSSAKLQETAEATLSEEVDSELSEGVPLGWAGSGLPKGAEDKGAEICGLEEFLPVELEGVLSA